MPRGPRAPRAIDGANGSQPVRNANQQALPFDEEANAHKLILKPAKNVDRMESLPPNPRLVKAAKSPSRQRCCKYTKSCFTLESARYLVA